MKPSRSLPAIPAGKQAPSYDAPPSAKRSASTKTLNPSEALALAGPALLQRMLEAVRLQAKAICEINLHEQGPLSSLRAQGWLEIVRLCVSVRTTARARPPPSRSLFGPS